MIEANMQGGEETLARFARIAPAVKEALRNEAAKLALKLTGSIRDDALSGGALNTRSGRLKSAVSPDVLDTDDAVRVRVFLDLNVARYGAFWESGFMRKAGAGARGGPGSLIGAARARYLLKHPAGIRNYPARAFMQPAFEAMRDEISATLIDAGVNALGEL